MNAPIYAKDWEQRALRLKLKELTDWVCVALEDAISGKSNLRHQNDVSAPTIASQRSAIPLNMAAAQHDLRESLLSTYDLIRATTGERAGMRSKSTREAAVWVQERLVVLTQQPEWSEYYEMLIEASNAAITVVDLPEEARTSAPWHAIPVEALDQIRQPVALTRLLAPFGIDIPIYRIPNWGKDGKLEVHSVMVDGKEQKQYRLGDVVDIWLELREKRAYKVEKVAG